MQAVVVVILGSVYVLALVGAWWWFNTTMRSQLPVFNPITSRLKQARTVPESMHPVS